MDRASCTINDDTGVNDVVFDPKNPDVILRSAVSAPARTSGQMIGGGPEGGIFKTTNARQELDEADEGAAGRRRRPHRAGVDPEEPGRVYALIDAKRPESGFFRSDDGGDVDADRAQAVAAGAAAAAPAAPTGAAAGPADSPAGCDSARRRFRRDLGPKPAGWPDGGPRWPRRGRSRRSRDEDVSDHAE